MKSDLLLQHRKEVVTFFLQRAASAQVTIIDGNNSENAQAELSPPQQVETGILLPTIIVIIVVYHRHIGLDWIGLDWIGLDWIGLAGLGRLPSQLGAVSGQFQGNSGSRFNQNKYRANSVQFQFAKSM